MQRGVWFLLLFHPLVLAAAMAQNDTECNIGSVNPLASSSLNACFKLYSTPKSYQAARRHCVSLGGQLAERINKDDSSLYSANADLEVTNATQFWVGASNLKCNVHWENGGEIEFNDLWASESRYYGVAIDKMSLGGLWHTVPVGHQLPFVCTFQGKPKNATAPVHALRAPAKKRVSKETEAKKEEDIDESLNAAQAEEKRKKEEAASMSASASESSASASESSESSSDSNTQTFEAMSASEISSRKEIGEAAIAMMSQEMNARSENYDKYTTEDLLSAAASLMGGYTVNMNWADSSTSSTFDSRTDERSMSLTMTIAEQRALAMEQRSRSESSSSDSMSMSEEASASAYESASASASESASASKSQSESSDSNSSSDSISLSASQNSKKKESDEEADLMSAAAILGGKKGTSTTSSTPTTEDDIDDSRNAALSDLKTTPPTVTPGCPGEWTQFNANSTAPPLCFRRFEKAMNFEDARLFCLARGGHLASIHNERQLLLLSALLHNVGPDAISNQTWIGLNRIHQKYYVYEDETAMDFTRWLPGAPNINDCTVFTGNELPNYPHKGTQYKFGDFPCEETQKSVLCEVTMGNDKEKTAPTCEQGWSYYSYDGKVESGKCYKHIEQSKKFTEARALCRSENSYLASIQNEGEARFVSALVQTAKNYTINEQTWIGYVKYDKEYQWEDGKEGVTFDPWTEKLPKDKKCTMFTGNEIHDDCRSKFRFVSVDCDAAQRAVLCSKPPMDKGVRFTYKDTENSSKNV